MISKNYYKISENLSPLQFQPTTKKEKSSLENIILKLNKGDLEVSSDFSKKWNEIKNNIERKKSGIGGLIFRFLFWLNGKNELIDAIDVKINRAEKTSPRIRFEREFKNFSASIVEDGNQAHEQLKDAPSGSYRLWRDKSNSEKFYLMYKASPERTYVEAHTLSLENKTWRSKTFENLSISSLPILDEQPENCTPLICTSYWNFDFFSVNTVIKHAKLTEERRLNNFNSELYYFSNLIFEDIEHAKSSLRPNSYVIYKDPQNPEKLFLVLRRKQIKVLPLKITHNLKKQIEEYIKVEQELEIPFCNSKQKEQCEQLHNEKQVFSSGTLTNAAFSLRNSKPGTYKLCRLDKVHYDLISHQNLNGEIVLVMMQKNGIPFCQVIPYNADVQEVIQENLKLFSETQDY